MLSYCNNSILEMSIFFINSNISRHLKLEIALAIPASNDEKYNWNNSAGQGLISIILSEKKDENNRTFFLSWAFWPPPPLKYHWFSNFCLLEGSCMKRNECGFRPPLCTCRLNWVKRAPGDGEISEMTLPSRHRRSEAEHATSRSQKFPTKPKHYIQPITNDNLMLAQRLWRWANNNRGAAN